MIADEINKKYKHTLIIFMVYLFAFNNLAFCQVDKLLSENVYIDPKGFFKIRPPAGWIIKEYSDDPRGKVDFQSSTTKPLAQIKIIAQISKFNSLEEAIEVERIGHERTKSRLKQSGMDLKVTTEITTKWGNRVIKDVSIVPGILKQEVISMLINNNYYIIGYASTPDLFNSYYTIAMKSINTFKPVAKKGGAKEAEQHAIASIIRRAQIYIQMGQKETAIKLLKEGMEAYPGNNKLSIFYKQIEN